VPSETIAAFIPLTTNGEFRSVAVLPDSEQDRVYFTVKRTVGGSSKYFIERMALDIEIAPGDTCKVIDCHTAGTNATASTTVSVGTHLVGASVVAWADGVAYPGPYTVNVAGNITLPTAVSDYVVGMSYRWRFKTSRLAYAAQGGTALLQPKMVADVGIIATDFHRDGISFGPDFDHLDPMPVIEDGITAGSIYNDSIYDNITIPFDGKWGTDSRVCLQGNSPYPCRLLGLVISMTTNDRL
jgi:hypothetical protein